MLCTVRHTGLRYVLEAGQKAGKQIGWTHFGEDSYFGKLCPAPWHGKMMGYSVSSLRRFVTIRRDPQLILASWITRKEGHIIERLSKELEEQEYFIKHGGQVANSPREAAEFFGIDPVYLPNAPVEATQSALKDALLAGEPPQWPEEYREFAQLIKDKYALS